MQFLHKTLKKPSKAAIVICSIIAAIAVVALVFFIVANSFVNTQNFYDGIYIGDVSVGGMTKESAAQAIADRYATALDADITLRCGEQQQVLNLLDLEAALDTQTIIDNAYNTCRDGNFFHRLAAVYNLKGNPVVYPPTITYNEDAVKDVLNTFSASVDQPGKEMELTISGAELTITKGVPGNGINIVKALENFKNTALTLSDGVFVAEAEHITPKEPVASEIFEQIASEPVDASYTIENRKMIVTEHKDGISFDIDAAQKIIDQSTGDTIVIPVTVTPPEMTTEKLQAGLFPDLLGSYSSRYNAKDTARSYNVSLAAQKINEIVLAPGDVFSYNDIVGPRTTAHGFRVANVYVGNRIEPGVGGGICQVSSTLFNAVVLADLKIVYRTNHSLPVSYVPLGRDATVSYGSIDFKFANSTNHPIKVVSYATGGTNLVSIYGVKENPGRTISISTECIGTRPPYLTQKEDPNLPEGTIKVEQAGSSGSTYNTYKIISENGKVVKTEFLTKSTYVPGERIEIIGTGPVEETEAVNGDVPPLEEGEAPVTGEEGVIPPASENPALPETEEPMATSAPESVATPAPSESPLTSMMTNPAA
ncbi:MAG: VanW family protein [Clostridia bacterium]|nr:VanW family protein [Clostridia bacterium]